MRQKRCGWLWLFLLGLTACSGQASPAMPTMPNSTLDPVLVTATALENIVRTRPYPTLNPAQVSLGRQIYVQHCAACHGQNAEGAPNWATPGPDGLDPPPPHDDTGHTWHHSDRVLIESIRDGLSDPLHPGSPLRMPAFGSILSDTEIRAVIEYFKSLWSGENRQWQWEQTLKDFKPTPTPFP